MKFKSDKQRKAVMSKYKQTKGFKIDKMKSSINTFPNTKEGRKEYFKLRPNHADIVGFDTPKKKSDRVKFLELKQKIKQIDEENKKRENERRAKPFEKRWELENPSDINTKALKIVGDYQRKVTTPTTDLYSFNGTRYKLKADDELNVNPNNKYMLLNDFQTIGKVLDVGKTDPQLQRTMNYDEDKDLVVQKYDYFDDSDALQRLNAVENNLRYEEGHPSIKSKKRLPKPDNVVYITNSGNKSKYNAQFVQKVLNSVEGNPKMYMTDNDSLLIVEGKGKSKYIIAPLVGDD